VRNGSCINSFLAFELASLLLELVFGPTPLSWGLLRSREGAFKGQPADEQAGVGTLFQRGLVALGCGRRSWRATVSFVCALMCATQSSLLVLKSSLGGTDLRCGPPLGRGPPSHDFGLPLHFSLLFLPLRSLHLFVSTCATHLCLAPTLLLLPKAGTNDSDRPLGLIVVVTHSYD
jgi:hypothetical protein